MVPGSEEFMGYKMLGTNIRKILTNWGKLVTWALWIRRKTALPVSMLTKSLSRPLLKGGSDRKD